MRSLFKFQNHERQPKAGLPTPTTRFRLRAWTTFQRALDPLGKPRPLRQPRH